MATKDSIEVLRLFSEHFSEEIVDLIGRAVAEQFRKQDKETQARYIQGHLIYRCTGKADSLWAILMRVAGRTRKVNPETNKRPSDAREVHWQHPLCTQAVRHIVKLGKGS